MKRQIILTGILSMLIIGAGCGRFTPRKDKNQIVEFANLKNDKNEYIIKLYKLNYPDTPNEKDKFYEEFDILTSKMVAYKRDINIIIPLELYKEIKNLGKREVREGEKIYSKQAYSLNDEEKSIIDSKIDVNYPKNAGNTQKYLNKQVAYWFKYLKRVEQYDKNKYYTELDKERLIDEVFQKREFLSKTSLLVQKDYAIEVTDTNLEEASNYGLPLYIKTNQVDVAQLEKMKSKIFIVDGKIQDRVIPGKLLLIRGMDVENIKDYKIKTLVENVVNPLSLISVLNEYKELELKDIENFTIKKIENSSFKKASVREKDRTREKLNFVSIESKWRIEK